MKRRIITILLALCLLVALAIPAMAAGGNNAKMDYVTDIAGVLSDGEKTALNSKSAELAEKYECGVYLLIVEDYTELTSNLGGIRDCAEGFYTANKLGWGADRNGVLLMLSMDGRDYALIAHGSLGNTVFSDAGKDILANAFLDNFKNDDWYGGCSDYLTQSGAMLGRAQNGGAPEPAGSNTNTAPEPVFSGSGLDNFKKINAYQQGQFYDVSAGDWFADNVKAAWEFGLMNGVSETQFSPAGSMTLAEAITLAARIHSIYYYGQANFEQGNPWYQSYVDYALRVGLIWDGQYSDYTRPATRAEFAVLLAASMASEALPGINSVSDIPDVQRSDSYGEAVFRLYNAGILTGSDAYGTFHPNNNIARSEVAAIVTRMADPGLRRTFTLEKSPVQQINDAMQAKYDSITLGNPGTTLYIDPLFGKQYIDIGTLYKRLIDLNNDGIDEVVTVEAYYDEDYNRFYGIQSCSICYWSGSQIVKNVYDNVGIPDCVYLVRDTTTGQYGLSCIGTTDAETRTYHFLTYSDRLDGPHFEDVNGLPTKNGKTISWSTFKSTVNRYQLVELLYGSPIEELISDDYLNSDYWNIDEHMERGKA